MSASNKPKTKRPDPLQVLDQLERVTRDIGLKLLIIATAVVIGLGIVIFFPATERAVAMLPVGVPILFTALLLTVLAAGLYSQLRLRKLARCHRLNLEAQGAEIARVEALYNRLKELNDSCRTLASRDDPGALYNRITQICFDNFACERVSLMLLDQKAGELEVRSAIGHGDMDLVLGARQSVGDGIAGWVADHNKPLLLGPDANIKKFWGHKPQKDPIHSAMSVPVALPEGLLGVLCMSTSSRDVEYCQEDLHTLQVLTWSAAFHIRQVKSVPRSSRRKSRSRRAA